MTLTQNYRRKPEPVEAVRLTVDNASEVAIWCGGEVTTIEKPSDPTDIATMVNFPTLTGPLVLQTGYYLVKNEKGAFSRISTADFERVYDVVEEPPVDPPVEEPVVPEDEYIPTA